jgi:hypothetical protein
MAQYRKKPVVIDAVQFTQDMLLEREPLPSGLQVKAKSWHPERGEVYSYKAGIDTLEGFMEARIGDWIITGVKGERYPCKSDVFTLTYEAVE